MAKDRVEAGRGRRADVVKKSKKSNTGFIGLLGVIAVWFAPETKGKPLPE